MSVTPGTELPAWRVDRVDPEKMKLFAAIARDPNTIHWDRAEVARRGLGERVINQGPTNLGYVINMLHAWAGPGCVRELTIRFTANVFDGDAVTSGGVVQSVDEAAGERRATCEVWLDRADGTRTVTGTAVVGLSA
jgi:acyl dehydratase